jgi:hypothetical protein
MESTPSIKLKRQLRRVEPEVLFDTRPTYLDIYLENPDLSPELRKNLLTFQSFELRITNLPLTHCQDHYQDQLPVGDDMLPSYPRELNLPVDSKLTMVYRALGPRRQQYLILNSSGEKLASVEFSLAHEDPLGSEALVIFRRRGNPRVPLLLIARILSASDSQEEFQKLLREWKLV